MNFRTSRQALRLAITTLGLLLAAAMIIAGSGFSPAAAATWNPPAPTSDDRGCIKWDRVWIPQTDDASYRVYGTSTALSRGWYYTKGASSVTIEAYDNFHPNKSFTLTFSTAPDSSCTEAQDTAQVSVGACNPATGGSPLTLNYRNVADMSGWPRDEANVVITRWDNRWDSGGVLVATKDQEVADGATASVSTFWNGQPIVAGPGTHTISLSVNGGALRQVGTIFVPSCKPEVPVPPGDPSGKGGPQGGTSSNSARPDAKVLKVTRKLIRLQLINRGVNSDTPFQIVAKPKGKKAKKVVRVISKGDIRIVTIKVRKAVKVKVKAGGRVVATRRL